MRAERGEEAAMLLSAYQQAAQRDADRMRQRRRAIRTLFGVVGAVALLVGCIAAVDVFALNGGNGESSVTLEVTTGYGDADGDMDDEAIAMESQFGWNSIGYGWCSLKSSTWCMFSKDKEQCKQGISCYKNREQASDEGSGSGSGGFNATVGDSDSDVGEDEETSSAAAPATPADNPTQPLDLGGDGGSDEEEDAPEDDEETPADDEEASTGDESAEDEGAPADEEGTAGDEPVAEDKDGNENMGGET
ncbi:Glyceraldehyde-3-phosphate dehydrogenase [Phytophthora cinnamomi]|uniref:Glyceraldehyde-3-phosphate dehydrogenase n=1 Tax=Phytophthora cinnamomi TaxID=4785 RepID=UPI00355A069A|nr:Glyceraldehyde-3-phosphate dehydrogenase [Phytophthora cinnamomi]